MNKSLKFHLIIFSLALLSCPLTVSAYVGPGPGLSFITSLLGFLAAIFTSLFLIVLWPIRKMLKRKKQKKTENSESK